MEEKCGHEGWLYLKATINLHLMPALRLWMRLWKRRALRRELVEVLLIELMTNYSGGQLEF